MDDETEIPVLTDLIEKGIEISMSELGLDDDLHIEVEDPAIDSSEIEITQPEVPSAELFADNPAFEQKVRRILDDHMEVAWQEIRLAIQEEFEKR
tara:strand:- start:429 stop:713 length:285 start_codon:yes stop_codon:yes gene_type:complete